MKNLIIALVLFSGLNLYAQQQIEKEVDYRGESVKLELDLASAIDVKTWDKPTIRVEASVETEDPKDTENFDLSIKRNGGSIEIASNSKEIFKVDGDHNVVINKNDDFDLNYTIYVPEGVELDLSSITGNVISEYLEGDISVELVTGNIEVKKFEGDLRLKTITGKINLPAKNTSYKAETVMGEIYVAADPNLITEKELIGQKMKLDLKGTKNMLSLSTVTGDIYLR